MRIISFGYTKHPLLAGTKTVTRRAWKKCSLKKGELVQAWDRSPRFKGKRIAIIRIKSVKREQLGYAATYGPKELKREGGLWKDWMEFFELFARSGVHPGDQVFRIEFELVKKENVK